MPYQPGELRAIGVSKGKRVTTALRTADEPAAIRLTADRSTIRADRNDLAYVTVEVVDSHGEVVPNADVPVRFTVSGAGELAATGSSSPNDAGQLPCAGSQDLRRPLPGHSPSQRRRGKNHTQSRSRRPESGDDRGPNPMKHTNEAPILKTKAIYRSAWLLLPITLIAVACASVATAAENAVVSPDGGLKVIVSDEGGLNYRVEADGKPVLTKSPLGLEFQDGTKLGPSGGNREGPNGAA